MSTFTYRLVWLKLLEIAGNKMLLVEDDIEAESYEVNEAGILTLYDEKGPFKSIPPGRWFDIDRIERQALIQEVR